MKQTFQMLAAYNSWANDRLYDASAALSEEAFGRDVGLAFGSVCRTFNHILVADRIWMKRFTGTGEAPKSLDLVLHEDFAGLRAARRTEDARISSWIEGLTEAQLRGRFSFTSITDMRTTSHRLAPVLTHVFNHQTHHRGQVHAALTGLGQESVVLDLVFFLRSEIGRKYS